MMSTSNNEFESAHRLKNLYLGFHISSTLRLFLMEAILNGSFVFNE
jgi:hypothetical protein